MSMGMFVLWLCQGIINFAVVYLFWQNRREHTALGAAIARQAQFQEKITDMEHDLAGRWNVAAQNILKCIYHNHLRANQNAELLIQRHEHKEHGGKSV